jgi:hypothetical protein
MKLNQVILSYVLILYIALGYYPAQSYSFSQRRDTTQVGCSLIEPKNAPVYITFERISEGKGYKDIVLRLVNNTSCPVEIEAKNKTILLSKTNKPQMIESSMLTDMAVYEVDYYIQDTRGCQKPRLHYIRECCPTIIPISSVAAGQSILFRVPLKLFKNQFNVLVPFRYAWEGNSMLHNVYFYADLLPKDLLNK